MNHSGKDKQMKRRSFIKAGVLGVAGGALAAPSIVMLSRRHFPGR
jgi:hypothetical protein